MKKKPMMKSKKMTPMQVAKRKRTMLTNAAGKVMNQSYSK